MSYDKATLSTIRSGKKNFFHRISKRSVTVPAKTGSSLAVKKVLKILPNFCITSDIVQSSASKQPCPATGGSKTVTIHWRSFQNSRLSTISETLLLISIHSIASVIQNHNYYVLKQTSVREIYVQYTA